MITDQEVLGERMQYRQRTFLEVRHDLIPFRPRRSWTMLHDIGNETRAPAVNLAQNVVEFMTWILRHSVVGVGKLTERVSRIRIVRIRSGRCVRINAFQVGIDFPHASEHPIKRVVLKHQNHYVADWIVHVCNLDQLHSSQRVEIVFSQDSRF